MGTMAGLVYGTDRQLRDSENVLAGFAVTPSFPWGCIVVDGRRAEIVRLKRTGWHFALRDCDTGGYLCEYVPSWFVRGGTIVGDAAQVTIRGVALHPRMWTFASEAGMRIDARVEDTRHTESFVRFLAKPFKGSGTYWRDRRSLRELCHWFGGLRLLFMASGRKARTSSPGGDAEVDAPTISSDPEQHSFFQVTLNLTGLGVAPEVSLELAFACWLLVERQSLYIATANPS
jgi:hypothetical protein